MISHGGTPMTSEIGFPPLPGFQRVGNGFFGKATPPPAGCGTACPDAASEALTVELCQGPLRACHRMLGTDEGHLHSFGGEIMRNPYFEDL